MLILTKKVSHLIRRGRVVKEQAALVQVVADDRDIPLRCVNKHL